MYPSTSSGSGVSPSGALSPADLFDGISRAPGANRHRILAQSRFSPALPEISRYDVEMIASIDSTSAGLTGFSVVVDVFIGALKSFHRSKQREQRFNENYFYLESFPLLRYLLLNPLPKKLVQFGVRSGAGEAIKCALLGQLVGRPHESAPSGSGQSTANADAPRTQPGNFIDR